MKSFKLLVIVFFFLMVSGCDQVNIESLVTANTPHFAGTYESGKMAIVSKPGEVGLLAYGPYIPLEKGKYIADFIIVATGTTQGELLGDVDVNGFTKERPENWLGKAAIRAAAGEQILPVLFSAGAGDVKFEFRVSANGKGAIEYKGVKIKKID